ncbi:MAG: enoyl-CoA hydratase-related protein [Desulforhopalus sp.]
MEYTNILIEKDSGIATLTINRPKSLNALNKETLEEMLACCKELRTDRSVQVLILTGAGDRSFVAGADISYMQGLDTAGGKDFGRLGHAVTRTIENLPQPVIAAINGFALGGGCELAISCDIRLASDNAKFGQPEVNLGVIPGFGGTQRLPRLIGKGLASELLFSGKIIDAAEAGRIGLVNRVVSQDDLMTECRELAEMICSRGPAAVRLCKEVVNNGMEMDLHRACSYEADLFALCFSEDEQKEGMTAFLEKRPPDFQNK